MTIVCYHLLLLDSLSKAIKLKNCEQSYRNKSFLSAAHIVTVMALRDMMMSRTILAAIVDIHLATLFRHATKFSATLLMFVLVKSNDPLVQPCLKVQLSLSG